MTIVQRWLLVAVFGTATTASAEDWPQYLGPKRDAVWREDGVQLDLKKHPPKLLWSTPIGGGYSGPAVAGGRVYVMDRQADRKSNV